MGITPVEFLGMCCAESGFIACGNMRFICYPLSFPCGQRAVVGAVKFDLGGACRVHYLKKKKRVRPYVIKSKINYF